MKRTDRSPRSSDLRIAIRVGRQSRSARLPDALMMGDEGLEIDVRHAIPVRQHERLVGKPGARRPTRPPVFVSGPVSTRCTVQSSVST